MLAHRNAATGHRASLFAIAVVLASSPANAFAYIDPGSGSLLLQLVMSAAFGALFFARNFLAKLARGFRSVLPGGKPAEAPKTPDEPGH